ncbi:MAG: hypothetical protein ACYS30_20600 [Planctomycetota bacterium]|jgi:hypothetical protein
MDSTRIISYSHVEGVIWVDVLRWISAPYNYPPERARFIEGDYWMDSINAWIGPDCHEAWIKICNHYPHIPGYCQ